MSSSISWESLQATTSLNQGNKADQKYLVVEPKDAMFGTIPKEIAIEEDYQQSIEYIPLYGHLLGILNAIFHIDRYIRCLVAAHNEKHQKQKNPLTGRNVELYNEETLQRMAAGHKQRFIRGILTMIPLSSIFFIVCDVMENRRRESIKNSQHPTPTS